MQKYGIKKNVGHTLFDLYVCLLLDVHKTNFKYTYNLICLFIIQQLHHMLWNEEIANAHTWILLAMNPQIESNLFFVLSNPTRTKSTNKGLHFSIVQDTIVSIKVKMKINLEFVNYIRNAHGNMLIKFTNDFYK